MSGISQRYVGNVQSIFELDFNSSVLSGNILFVDVAPTGHSLTILQRILSFSEVKNIDIVSKKEIWKYSKSNKIKQVYGYNTDFLLKENFSDDFWIELDKKYSLIIISTNENPRNPIDFLNYFNVWKLFINNPNKVLFIDRSYCIKSYYSFMGIKEALFVDQTKYYFYMMISDKARQAFVDRAFESAKNGEVIEIGRAFGGSTVALALAIGEKDSFVHSIDIKTDDLFDEYVSFYQVNNKIKCYNGGSLQTNYYLKKTLGKSVSFIFIDGDHKEEAIALDIRIWSELLISGGTICLHEYGHNDINQSTRVVFEEIISKPELFYDFKRVGDIFFARKK